MENNERIEVENIGNENANDNSQYIEALNSMKQNSVSKDQYAKLQQENKKLLDALVSNKQIDLPEEKPADVNELRQKLFNNEQGINNLEYIDTALQLRKAIMDKDGNDPFLPVGSHVQLTYDMQEKAQEVADVLQECVDFASGDSGIFTAELQRRTRDTGPQRKFR